MNLNNLVLNSDVKCPCCGSKARTELGTYSTCLAVTRRYDEEGNLIPTSDPNIVTTEYSCTKCGVMYSADNKGNTKIIRECSQDTDKNTAKADLTISTDSSTMTISTFDYSTVYATDPYPYDITYTWPTSETFNFTTEGTSIYTTVENPTEKVVDKELDTLLKSGGKVAADLGVTSCKELREIILHGLLDKAQEK